MAVPVTTGPPAVTTPALDDPPIDGGGTATTEVGAPDTTVATPTAGPWENATANLAGMESECGNLSGMSVRPDRDVVIAGVALQGLWASVDGAEEWAPIGTGTEPEIDFRLSSVVYDPEHPDTFWASGLYHGPGVMRTDDGGTTFVRLGDVPMSDLVSVDFSDPSRQTLVAASHESRALYASKDGGDTWTDISAGLPETIGYATSPVVIDANTYVLGTSASPTSGIFRTTDGGATWQPVFSGAISGAPVVGEDGSITFVLAASGIVVSADQGATWTARGGPPAGSLVDLPGNALAAFSATGVVVSADAGQTWARVGDPLPIAANGLVYSATRGAFYAWYFQCGFDGPVPVAEDSIVRMEVDLSAMLDGSAE